MTSASAPGALPTAEPIPKIAHFVWLGARLPYSHVLAIRSAALRGGFDRVILLHDTDLSDNPHFTELLGVNRLQVKWLDPFEVLGRVREFGSALIDIYSRLIEPAARCNLLRLALLLVEGGVYLDLDTITLRSLGPLCERGAFFCGQEHLVFPEHLRILSNPGGYALALLRAGARDVMRRSPGGWRWFLRFARLYPRAVNNAVMGSCPGHPFVRQLLEAAVRLVPRRQMERYALGTSLLQRELAALTRAYPSDSAILTKKPIPIFHLGRQDRGTNGLLGQAQSRKKPALKHQARTTNTFTRSDRAVACSGRDALPIVHVEPPERFYPLGPEVSQHWFRLRRDARDLDELFDEGTSVVHWYASVRTRVWTERLEPSCIRRLADRQWFSRLASSLLL